MGSPLDGASDSRQQESAFDGTRSPARLQGLPDRAGRKSGGTQLRGDVAAVFTREFFEIVKQTAQRSRVVWSPCGKTMHKKRWCCEESA